MAVISRIKIDSVVDEATKPLKEKIQKLEKSIKEDVESYICNSLIPGDVMELFNKYPKVFEKTGYFVYVFNEEKRRGNGSISLYMTCPDIEALDITFEQLQKDKGLSDLILVKCKELEEMSDKKDTLVGTLTCVLSELKTYAKIKKELPDIYEILMKQENGPSTTLCDSVEEVQARLEDIKQITN